MVPRRSARLRTSVSSSQGEADARRCLARNDARDPDLSRRGGGGTATAQALCPAKHVQPWAKAGASTRLPIGPVTITLEADLRALAATTRPPGACPSPAGPRWTARAQACRSANCGAAARPNLQTFEVVSISAPGRGGLDLGSSWSTGIAACVWARSLASPSVARLRARRGRLIPRDFMSFFALARPHPARQENDGCEERPPQVTRDVVLYPPRSQPVRRRS